MNIGNGSEEHPENVDLARLGVTMPFEDREQDSPRIYRFPATAAKFVISILLLCAGLLAPRGYAQQDEWSGVQRIVAIGDIHGDYEQFITLLRDSGLIDQRNRWIGGKAHLVQLGDVPDRGSDTRKVLELLMKLEKEAARAGGMVHALIGNHEAMNIYGDLRYVSPEDFASYRDRNSVKTREYFYQQEIENARISAPEGEMPEFDDQHRRDWEARHPLGYFEQRFAFSERGIYGQWIREHNAVIKVNDTLFLHGGISPQYAASSVREINQQIRSELADFRKLQGGMVIDETGPLWYRGLALDDETMLMPHVDQVLQYLGVRRIVVGHTVTQGTVIPRFYGKVLLADAGMSALYGSRRACLILDNDGAWVLHRGKKLSIPTDSRQAFVEYLKKVAALDPQPSPLEMLLHQIEDTVLTPTVP